MTPWELLTGIKPNVEHVSVWGSKVIVHTFVELQQGHFHPWAQEGVLLGFDTHNPKRYTVLFDGVVYHRSDIHFMEGENTQHLYASHLPGVHASPAIPALPSPPLPTPNTTTSSYLPSLSPNPPPSHPTPLAHEPSWKTRVLRSATRKQEQVLALLAMLDPTISMYEPLTLSAALDRPDASQWIAACMEELEGLDAMRTWILVDCPSHCNVLPVTWVFKVKRNEHGSLDRYKARLCAKGFKQKVGDYQQIFAAVSTKQMSLL